jgi:hypothetical protein
LAVLYAGSLGSFFLAGHSPNSMGRSPASHARQLAPPFLATLIGKVRQMRRRRTGIRKISHWEWNQAEAAPFYP